jgi:hypothetical protein
VTATLAPIEAKPEAKPRTRSRRWMRAAGPFIVLLCLWIVTGVAHFVEEPDLGDPGTLSPTGTGPDGSSQLAEALQTRGIHIDVVTSGAAALTAAGGDESTIFVPEPDFMSPTFTYGLGNLSGHHRVVLVAPGRVTMTFLPMPIFDTGERWATGTALPDCTAPYAQDAGRASVRRFTYNTFNEPSTVDCYHGSVVRIEQPTNPRGVGLAGTVETIVVGANDPFRNGRIGEHGNAVLATELLTANDRLIWVDVHKREPRPRGDLNLQLPQYRRGNQDRHSQGDPLFQAFPAGLWAMLVLALTAAALLGVVRARRLGPPVSEPLPVLVPAAESVTGRGRLYERISARGATLEALQSAAIIRLARVVDPYGGVPERELIRRPGDAPSPAAEALIAKIAERIGWPAETVRYILFARASKHDDGLARAVADLDDLVDAVLHDNPTGQPERGGTP